MLAGYFVILNIVYTFANQLLKKYIMKNMKPFFYLLFVFLCWGCTSNSEKKKYLKRRENIVNVHDRIKEIHIPEEDVLINNNAKPYIVDDYLIIRDYKTYDKLLHLFDKQNFRFIKSFADRGNGPGEITRSGHVEFDKVRRLLYLNDPGKYKIFSYHIDSVIRNDKYKPAVRLDMKESIFPRDYLYIHDTLCIAQVITPIGNSDFRPSIARWNMNTGEIKLMPYEHPHIDKKRIVFAASKEKGLYAECHCNRDLMTICDVQGNLICNVYGPDWGERHAVPMSYYEDVAFCNNKIITVYLGDKSFSKERTVNLGTRFLIFDLNGDYLKTLETGYHIVKFCYDKDHNRIIMSLDDVIQFAHLDLEGLLD